MSLLGKAESYDLFASIAREMEGRLKEALGGDVNVAIFVYDDAGFQMVTTEEYEPAAAAVRDILEHYDEVPW